MTFPVLKISKKVSLVQFEFPQELSFELRATHEATTLKCLEAIFKGQAFSLEMLYRSVETLCKYSGCGKLLYEKVNDAIATFCQTEICIRDVSFEKIVDSWNLIQEKLFLIEVGFAYLFEVWVHMAGNTGYLGLRQVVAGHFRHLALGGFARDFVSQTSDLIGIGSYSNPPLVGRLLEICSQIGLINDIMNNIKESIEGETKRELAKEFDGNRFDKIRGVYLEHTENFSRLLPGVELAQKYRSVFASSYLGEFLTGNLPVHLEKIIREQNFVEYKAANKSSQDSNMKEYFVKTLHSVLRGMILESLNDGNISLEKRMLHVMVLKGRLVDWNEKCEWDIELNCCFEKSLNEQSTLAAELLSCYCDYLVKQNPSFELFKSESAEIISIFRLLGAKEHFEQVYKRMLARRLIVQRGAENKLEEYLIEMFGKEAGSNYSSRMLGMYREMEQALIKLDSNCSALVLASGLWPQLEEEQDEFEIPAESELGKIMVQLEHLYQRENQAQGRCGRQLVWLNTLSTVTMLIQFPRCGTKEFILSLPQALVLYLYRNESPSSTYTLSQLGQLSGIRNSKYLDRVLKSLTTAKFPVLTIVGGDGQDVSYTINRDLEFSQTRVRLLLYSTKELLQLDTVHHHFGDCLRTEQSTTDQNHHQVDAAMVRLMKQLRSCELVRFFNLLGEQYPAISQSVLQQHLDNLIEREYLSLADSQVKYIP